MDALKSQLRKYEVRDYAVILFGTLLYGFGFNGFILSNEIVTGGLSGLCALIFLLRMSLFRFPSLTLSSTYSFLRWR